MSGAAAPAWYPNEVDRFWDGLAKQGQALRELVVADRLNLAVTGLRRSGKTVLTTALVHHLLDAHDLPFMAAAQEGRLLGARRLPPAGGPTFPFEALREALTATEPRWPEPTRALSTLRLGLRYATGHPLRRQIKPLRELELVIVDYPGEWLLDLPLLDLEYDQFAAAALALAALPPRAAIATEWLALARAAAASATADPLALEPLVDAFTHYLRRCQGELGLALIQPGRFTEPGPDTPPEALRFAPLPPGMGGPRALMAERFNRYREDVVRRFYLEHFSRFDRQIVLVDLLGCLNAGPGHFTDTQAALATLVQSFQYGSSGWLRRLVRPRIERVVFAASKADHVAPSQHAALRQLLEVMVRPAARQARLENVRPEVLALAALRCTDVVQTEHQGQTLSCLRGRLKRDGRETVLYPGEVPPTPPDPADWPADRFHFADFAPRRLIPGLGGQHIRLDQALEHLLGDRLR